MHAVSFIEERSIVFEWKKKMGMKLHRKSKEVASFHGKPSNHEITFAEEIKLK